MKQQAQESKFDDSDSLDLLPTASPIQSSSMTRDADFSSFSGIDLSPDYAYPDVGTRVLYDYNTLESFCEINVADLNMTMYQDDIFREILDHLTSIDPLSEDFPELLTESSEVYHPTESDDMQHKIQSPNDEWAMIKLNGTSLPIIRSHTGKSFPTHTSDQSILLSQSVAVTVPTPNQLQLVYPLEDTYRARYKSDYFPQRGAVRRPRYIADSCGNHFITIQMPKEYLYDSTQEFLRIALITTFIPKHGHFYSPYKFQADNNDATIPDENPIYLPIRTNAKLNFQMKLHLVLIKSKLDQLNSVQPLKPFSYTVDHVQDSINEDKLTPKELINKYQLDKSHLAFTLCTKLSDGSYDIHSETTVLSSVISEASVKPSTIKQTGSRKKVCCPHCSSCFELNDADLTEGVSKRKSSKSTSRSSSKVSTNNHVKKKKKYAF